MIKNFSIQNFRSHKDVVLKDCGPVNILLGRNNTGKTAILEAIMLLSFPMKPREVLNLLNEQRGYKPGDENHELWDSYFYNWDHRTPISISADENQVISLFDSSRNLFIAPIIGSPKSLNATSVIEGRDLLDETQGLILKYKYEENNVENKVTTLKRRSRKQLTPKAKQMIEQICPIAFIPSKGISNPQDEAERFSRLEKANRHHEVEEALQAVDPRLQRLTVIASGQSSMIYGDIGEGHLVPVSLMGEGMVRMLSIATAMANNKAGIVLIDEIENGLHYSVLPSLWKMIFNTAHALNIQVFAATHSDECLHAASQIAQSQTDQKDLRLFRLDLRNGETYVTDYTADELSAAIGSDQEVR
jgi:AAA15 family ATPase/GTPase